MAFIKALLMNRIFYIYAFKYVPMYLIMFNKYVK